MGVYLINQETAAAMRELIKRARAKPIPWGALKPIQNATSILKLADRGEAKRPQSENLIIGTYRLALSFEEQPTGLCRHLSISTLEKGLLPNAAMIQQITEGMGMKFPIEARVWLEEFEPNHFAVNVVALDEKCA